MMRLQHANVVVQNRQRISAITQKSAASINYHACIDITYLVSTFLRYFRRRKSSPKWGSSKRDRSKDPPFWHEILDENEGVVEISPNSTVRGFEIVVKNYGAANITTSPPTARIYLLSTHETIIHQQVFERRLLRI